MSKKKDKLIAIVEKAKELYASDVTDHSEAEYIVEALLDEGVILPPCAIGDKAYRITYSYSNGKRMQHISGPIQIVGFHLGAFPTIRGHKRKNYLIGYNEGLLIHLDINEIGESIFFSEEEAKQKQI